MVGKWRTEVGDEAASTASAPAPGTRSAEAPHPLLGGPVSLPQVEHQVPAPIAAPVNALQQVPAAGQQYVQPRGPTITTAGETPEQRRLRARVRGLA